MKYFLTAFFNLWAYLALGQIDISAFKETIDSTRTGEEIVNFKNGNRKFEINYLKGQLHGKAIYYYDNGNKEKEGQFYKGTKTGLFRFWYRDGQLAAETNTIEGEFDLTNGKYWDRKGNRITEKQFKKIIEEVEKEIELKKNNLKK